MKIAITGSHGLLGSALAPQLAAGGHEVVKVVRPGGEAAEGAAVWDPARGLVDPRRLEGVGAVVHLAGETIAGRWTAARKERIRESRVTGTRRLCEGLAALAEPPGVLVAASAIGFYGDRGDQVLTEEAGPGTDFLASVCQGWEAACDPLRAAGARVVHLRFGMILSPAGGALAKMLPPFRLGLGGRVGSGQQWMSWIALDDAVGAVLHALREAATVGPVNAVAPEAVRNADFTKTLGRVLGRPTIFPLPAAAARLLFGEMADALLLASTRVAPARLAAAGFRHRFPELEDALRHLLGRPAPA